MLSSPLLVRPDAHMGVIDLFAGPGGWDVAARELGMDPLGIEWDDAACATRKAAGLSAVQGDVAEQLCDEIGPLWGLIASPPCQAWSMAGKRAGERDKQHVLACSLEIAAGNDTRAEHREKCEDPRSMLVVEPLRWALALKPAWIACEQVPPVLELWTLYAQILEHHGYRCWAGVLSAERFGVPQTRKRAVLMAKLGEPVRPPEPTHQAYVPGEPAEAQHTLEGELLPWVSMAEALGWEGIDRPAPTVTGGGSAAGGPEPFARGGREAIQKIRTNNFTAKFRDLNGSRSSAGSTRYEREIDAPAPSVTTRTDLWERPAPTLVTTRRSSDGLLVGRQLPEGEGENIGGWGWERPSTTVNTTNGLGEPGHHGEKSMSHNAVRVTVEEAAALQGFPPDYPWQGTRSKQFEQVGNAVPPPLAKAILGALIA